MPSYTITGRNGKSYTIEGPAGATRDQVIAAVVARDPDAANPPQAASTPASPEHSLLNKIGMGVRAAIGGIGDTLETAASGLPGMSIQRAMVKQAEQRGAKTSVLERASPAEAAKLIADKLGLTTPATTGEKLASGAISGITGALVGGGPIGGAEELALKAIPTVGKRVAARLAQKAPEVIGGAAAGATAEGANEANLPWYAALPLSVAAGAIVPSAASITKNGLGKIRAYSRFDPTGGVERAGSNMKANTVDPAAALAAIENRTLPTTGIRPIGTNGVADAGLGPTTAEITGDAANAALQRERPSNLIMARQENNAAARMAAIQQTMGEGDTAALPALAARRADEGQAALDAAHVKLGSANPADRGQSGADVRDAFNARYQSAKAATEDAYNAPILKTAHPITLPARSLQDVRDVLERYYGNAGGTISAKTQGVLGDLFDHMDANPTATEFKTNSSVLTNIDERLADAAGTAKGTGARREARAIQELRNGLTKDATPQLPDGYVDALKTARAARLDQGQRFEQGRMGPTFGVKNYGEQKLDDITLAGRLVQNGPAGGTLAKQLTAAVGPQASEAAIRQEIARRVASGQLITAKQLTGINELFSGGRFPGLKSDIEALHGQLALNDVFAKSPLGQIGDLSRSPTARIADLLNAKDDGRSFKELTDQVVQSGDQDALAGLRKTIANHIEANSAGTREAGTGGAISDNAKALSNVRTILDRGGAALTDEQRKVFQQLEGEYSRTQSVKTAGTNSEGISDGLNNLPAHPIVARTLRFISDHFGNKHQVDALIQKALLDPDFAGELLKRPTVDRLDRLKRTVRRAVTGATLGTIAGPVPAESQ